MRIAAAKFVMPDDDVEAPGYKPHGVEVLGNGQQLVAYSVHKDTGRPYEWLGRAPHQVPMTDLTLITESQASAFVADAEELLERAGGMRKGGTRQPGSTRSKPPTTVSRLVQPAPKSFRMLGIVEIEEVRDALRWIPNADLSYDDWIRVGLALMAALGDAGWPLWEEWSAQYVGNTPEVISAKWASFRPQVIGSGTLFWIARQHGWPGPIRSEIEGPLPFYPDQAVPLSEAERQTREAIAGFLACVLADHGELRVKEGIHADG